MTPTGRISSFELAQKLLSLPDWTLDGRGLRAAYRFDSASTALQFIVQVGLRCEQDNWHPHLDWRVTTGR
ncbi:MULTISPECIES: 4a-hydroxytetrahydrobiopterin dehydratase [Glutamicibacter]|nr:MULTISPECIES: 4a-hydroxytetrahydrobiopterin dehydratase [Glutamicibacter]